MVNVDKVYQRVLALANKEQRGYITPQEFNLFANQAQMDIFEQYFYDLNQFKRVPGNDTIYADPVSILNEKISLFEVAVGTNSIIGWGMDGNSIVIPDEVYRLSQVRLAGFPVEFLPTKEFNMVRESPLTKPTEKRPIARRDFRGMLIFNHNGVYTPAPPPSLGINASYIKKPEPVNWVANSNSAGEVTLINGIAMYDNSLSTNFELHDSEETNLVIKILGLAGIAMKDTELYQIGLAEDNKNVQQEKQ
tara:strand:+ start:48 stop:794 length:747 start_codon:yes stop_codon:yes gene_type:complete